jgi:hypothetical protein
MNKIPSDKARNRAEIKHADEFLKGRINTIAESWKDKCNTEQERLTAHGTMVAQITALCMDIITLYTGDDVKRLGGSGGVYKLNKYLALRQLCERQIKGIQDGHWGLKSEFTKSDPFISTVSMSQGLFIQRQEIEEFLNVVEILDGSESRQVDDEAPESGENDLKD